MAVSSLSCVTLSLTQSRRGGSSGTNPSQSCVSVPEGTQPCAHPHPSKGLTPRGPSRHAISF